MQNKRINIIDEARGLAIILVMVYHLFYDLAIIHKVHTLWGAYSVMRTLQPVLPFVFILISGISFQLSHNNIRRGIIIGIAALAVTLVSKAAAPEYAVTFGILHFLAVMHIGFGIFKILLDRIPSFVWIILCALSVVLFVMTFYIQAGYLGIKGLFTVSLPEGLYQSDSLMAMGFHTDDFVSSDYNPVFPWIFVFIIGMFLGRYVHRLPEALKKPHIPPLAFLGRHTLIIYILHQPVIYGVLWLILPP